jgi:hypothetical protein
MKEIMLISAILILFFIVSFFLQKKMIHVNRLMLIFSILIYFISINLFFDGFLKFNEYLKTLNIHFDFGHANLLIGLLYLICMVGAIGFTINIFVLRSKYSK